MPQTQLLETIIDKLKDAQGLKAIILGGSWASGTRRPDSDIDLPSPTNIGVDLGCPVERKRTCQTQN